MPEKRQSAVQLKVYLPLAVLLVASSPNALAGLRKTVTVADPDPQHMVTKSWYDNADEAMAACQQWAGGLSCGGGAGPGLHTSEVSAGWATGPNSTFTFIINYYCDNGYSWDTGLQNCIKLQKLYSFSQTLPSCSTKAPFGNPIEPLNGKKAQDFDLGIGVRNLRFSLAYDSLRVVLAKQQSQAVNALGAIPSVGGEWTPSWAASLYQRPDQESGKYAVQYFDNRGGISTFQGTSLGTGATLSSMNDPQAQLQVVDGYGTWWLRDPAAGVFAVFVRATSQRYAMSELWRPDGSKVSIRVSGPADPMSVGNSMVNGLAISVSDPFGQYAVFRYGQLPATGDAQVDAKVTKILSTSGAVDLGYSADGKLNSLTWPDGNAQGLVLESTANGVGPMLTGVTDEDGKRFSTFAYDADGYATSTERAGGTLKYTSGFTTRPELQAVQDYDAASGMYTQSFKLSAPSSASVTGPNGQSVTISSASVRGLNVPVSQSQPAGSGCVASTRSQEFDTNGNLNWKEDFKGYRTCYANDLTRNLGKARVEGLATGTACASLLVDGATLPAGSRKVTTAWHPVWNMETKVAEPRRLVTKVYNGQPDPFNSNAIASCAPSTAQLPDGSAIVVLCKRVEQATTDADGSKGFNATLDTVAGVQKREEKWTYDGYGRVLTYSDPRSNVTTYAYFADTTSDHTPGDLDSITNAKQQATHFTKYNSSGQWLEMTDVNNVQTVRTFDARQRLKTVTVGTSQTSYDYWPTGLLKSVTFPDTSSLSYGYDDAHRLTTITDNLGNTITYTLDNSGVRTGETITDPTGALAKSLTRLPDALNRIQQVTGRE